MIAFDNNMDTDLSKWTEIDRFEAIDDESNLYTVIKLEEPQKYARTLDGIHPVGGKHNAFLTDEGLHLNRHRDSNDTFTIAETGTVIQRHVT